MCLRFCRRCRSDAPADRRQERACVWESKMEPYDWIYRQVGLPPRTHPTPSFTVFKPLHFILSFAAVLATLHHSFVIYSSRGLPTDRPMWSDESGLKECIKGSTYPPSPQWSWVGRIRGIGSSEIFIFLSHWHSPPWTFVSGVRVGRGLQRPRRNGQRRLAVCCRLSHVRKLFYLFLLGCLERSPSLLLTHLLSTGHFMATKPWKTLLDADDGLGEHTIRIAGIL